MMRPDYMEMLGKNLPSNNPRANNPIEPKRVGPNTGPGPGNNPIQRDWNGWQETAPNEPNPMGGGGPMPIPDGGPNWKGNPSDVNPYELDKFMDPNFKGSGPFTGYDQNYWDKKRGNTGGFDPVGPSGGLGGPQSGPWGGGQFNPANVDVPNGSGAGGPMPRPWPQGASPVPGNPNAFYMQNHPSNPNSKYAQWKASQQQAPPAPGNTGIVPPHMGDGMQGNDRILGGPYGPPHPQGGPQVPQAADPMPAPMAPTPFQRMRQTRQFQPHGFGGMNGGRVPQWQNAMGNSPQGRMDFLNKLKQSYSGGQGFKWNF